jgi:hypothetical protein
MTLQLRCLCQQTSLLCCLQEEAALSLSQSIAAAKETLLHSTQGGAVDASPEGFAAAVGLEQTQSNGGIVLQLTDSSWPVQADTVDAAHVLDMPHNSSSGSWSGRAAAAASSGGVWPLRWGRSSGTGGSSGSGRSAGCAGTATASATSDGGTAALHSADGQASDASASGAGAAASAGPLSQLAFLLHKGRLAAELNALFATVSSRSGSRSISGSAAAIAAGSTGAEQAMASTPASALVKAPAVEAGVEAAADAASAGGSGLETADEVGAEVTALAVSTAATCGSDSEPEDEPRGSAAVPVRVTFFSGRTSKRRMMLPAPMLRGEVWAG